MPGGVTGIRVSGRLHGDDLREFKPAMEELLKTLIADLKLGFSALIQHHAAFKRIAIVSNKDWIAHAVPCREVTWNNPVKSTLGKRISACSQDRPDS